MDTQQNLLDLLIPKQIKLSPLKTLRKRSGRNLALKGKHCPQGGAHFDPPPSLTHHSGSQQKDTRFALLEIFRSQWLISCGKCTSFAIITSRFVTTAQQVMSSCIMTHMEEGFSKSVKIWYLNLCSYLLQAYLKKNIHRSPEALPEANTYDHSYIGIKSKQLTDTESRLVIVRGWR